MCDNENNTTAGGDESVGGMAAADIKFLVTCLQNTTGGWIVIDINKVARIVNFKNVKSVANKISHLKKKFDLPIGTTSGGGAGTPNKASKTPTPRKASAAASPKDPAIPKTPSKTHVTKHAPSSTTKQKPGPKGRKVNREEEAKAESDDEMKEELIDEATETQNAYEEVFGKSEEDEDEDNEDGDEDEDDDAYAA